MPHEWRLTDRVLSLGARPLIMGIVNVTPDSFSDGGLHSSPEAAIEHGLRLIAEGADILDIGGESTRPGSQPVSVEEELCRVVPVVRGLRERTQVPLSIDTSKAAVARASLELGAHIVNDVTALRDPLMASVVREFGAGVVLMHMQGTPATMQLSPTYRDIVADVVAFLQDRLQATVEVGIDPARVVLDPGIGFGKTSAHNLELLANLDAFSALGRPLLLGVSRKGLVSRVLGVEDRLVGSLAALCPGICRKAVHVVRVHDVRATRDLVTMLAAIEEHRRVPG